MKQLLDTHAVLWFLQGAKEAAPVRQRIEAGHNIVSVAVFWEAAIKVSIGKLKLPYAVERLPELCHQNGFELLDISATEAVAVAKLPWHHRDPFDRLLVAQCLSQGFSLLSRDPQFDAYGVKRWWG